MSVVTTHVWSCPVCGGTVALPDRVDERGAVRLSAQLDHARRHTDEGAEAPLLRDALDEALKHRGTGTARVMVHPSSAAWLRAEAIRRGVPVVVCESYALEPARGLPLPATPGHDRRGRDRV